MLRSRGLLRPLPGSGVLLTVSQSVDAVGVAPMIFVLWNVITPSIDFSPHCRSYDKPIAPDEGQKVNPFLTLQNCWGFTLEWVYSLLK